MFLLTHNYRVSHYYSNTKNNHDIQNITEFEIFRVQAPKNIKILILKGS